MNRKYLFLILLSICIGQNCTTTNKDKSNINPSSIKKNKVKLIPHQKDTIVFSDYYGVEIHIPNFDTSGIYSCLIGNYEVKIYNNDTILEMTSDYDSLYPSRIPGIFYLLIKPSISGDQTYRGFIRKHSPETNEYFPFKGSFYVE
jgi:hypothetical protein